MDVRSVVVLDVLVAMPVRVLAEEHRVMSVVVVPVVVTVRFSARTPSCGSALVDRGKRGGPFHYGPAHLIAACNLYVSRI
jgi:hypothetical protein